MPTEFKIPELGENVTSGDVVRILVKPGDALVKDQPVLELETDKATIEVPSSVAGTVKEVKVKQGDKVQVGQLVLTVDGEAGASAQADAGKAMPAQQPPTAAAAPGQAETAADRCARRRRSESAGAGSGDDRSNAAGGREPVEAEARRGRGHHARRETGAAGRTRARPAGSGRGGRSGHSRGPIRPSPRPRARCGRSTRAGYWSGRAHQRGGRAGIRSQRARLTAGRRHCGAGIARLLEVG